MIPAVHRKVLRQMQIAFLPFDLSAVDFYGESILGEPVKTPGNRGPYSGIYLYVSTGHVATP